MQSEVLLMHNHYKQPAVCYGTLRLPLRGDHGHVPRPHIDPISLYTTSSHYTSSCQLTHHSKVFTKLKHTFPLDKPSTPGNSNIQRLRHYFRKTLKNILPQLQALLDNTAYQTPQQRADAAYKLVQTALTRHCLCSPLLPYPH